MDALRLVGLGRGPRVLGAGVEGGARQVEPHRAVVGAERLRLQPGQQAEGLRVALEPAAVGAELGEHPLAVVPERRVAEVVRQRGGLDDVGLAAEGARQVPGDLGDLEAVGQPVAHEVVGLRPDDLGLGGQPARRRRVHHPGAVALERRALGRGHPLGRLGDEALAVRGGVQVRLESIGADPSRRRRTSVSRR